MRRLRREQKRVTPSAPNVLPLPLYQPVHVAEEALVLDVLSGGRFLLGVGAGYIDLEFEALGSVLNQRPSRLEEGLAVIRAAFRGESFSTPVGGTGSPR